MSATWIAVGQIGIVVLVLAAATARSATTCSAR